MSAVGTTLVISLNTDNNAASAVLAMVSNYFNNTFIIDNQQFTPPIINI